MEEREGNESFDTICLQGNSTKCLISLGAIQFLHDTGRLSDVTKFFGTSSGGIISFFLIIGYNPIEILRYLCVNKVLDGNTIDLDISKMVDGSCVISWSKIREVIETMTIQKIGCLPTLKCLSEKTGKEITVVTYNITEEKTEYISATTYPNLPILTALRMTANIPFVFEKCEYKNSFFIDGGIADNFPLKKAEERGNKVIGIRVDLNSKKDIDEDTKESNIEYLQKLIMLPIRVIERNQISTCRENTRVETLEDLCGGFGIKFSSTEIMNLFSSGYKQMKERFE
jgi:predicted acylesterase/phospholipase RssA